MNLVARVQRILFRPKQEWQAIDAEPATASAIFAGYVLPMCAIGPVASLIGLTVFGIRVPFGETLRVPLGTAVSSAVLHWVLAVVGIFVLALLIDALAAPFGGQKSSIRSLKVAAYSSTAAWVAGIFSLVPVLSVLGLLGLYSLYLLFLGLPVLMKVPQEKALGYTIVVVVCAIVLFIAIAMIAAIPLGLQRLMTGRM
ncbi:MAG: YIP1 family protein [Acidobacteriia bacterium]|nr:YIP1 family protein [Terriglobia bacterium]